jgi:hypothetical protein
MKLTEKQMDKIVAIVAAVDITDAKAAVEAIAEHGIVKDGSAGAIKTARKALVKQVRILDKALAVYDIDLATDEAKAFIEKVDAKLAKKRGQPAKA